MADDGAIEHVDVLIVGAGISGIAAAYYVGTKLPAKRYAILEGRSTIGGTWDLFTYPGIRSDSDMHTLGFSFHPWRGDKSIADGASIAAYVRETAATFGIDRNIRFEHRAVRAAWSSANALWTVDAEVGEAATPARFTCRFLSMCSGYYDYARGYTPNWPGLETFGGTLVHPQHWPASLDYDGKHVIVVGSGATAVTLVPALAERAEHVTMLQRSPTYVVARPAHDSVANWLHRKLPTRLAGRLARWKNVLLGMYFYRIARRRPAKTRAAIAKMARAALPPGYDVATHFTPRYDPWDQRLCLAADGDIFKAVRTGKASIVTDHIERFTPAGVRLRSGAELEADVVIAATGLSLQLLGGMTLHVDGVPVDLGDTLSYKGMMFSDVPNLSLALGYTNASWTLKCELTANYVCRLLRHMDARGFTTCVPRRESAGAGDRPTIALTSGYVQRAASFLPKQGARSPWVVHQNYARDLAAMRFGRVRDGVMQFARTGASDRIASHRVSERFGT
jgi:monooxygenase